MIFSTYFQYAYACRPMDRWDIQNFPSVRRPTEARLDASLLNGLTSGQSLGTFIAETPSPFNFSLSLSLSLSLYLDASKG
jgi:hypothetical protein